MENKKESAKKKKQRIKVAQSPRKWSCRHLEGVMPYTNQVPENGQINAGEIKMTNDLTLTDHKKNGEPWTNVGN